MAVDQFLTYLQHEKRYSPHTLQSYQTDLLQFRDFIDSTYALELGEVKVVHVRDFMVWLMDQGISESSVGRKLSALRSFYKYQMKLGLLTRNPISMVKAPKVPSRLPVIVSDEQLDHLLDSDQFFDSSFPSQRDKLVIEAFLVQGCV